MLKVYDFCKCTYQKRHNSQTNLRVANKTIFQLHKIDNAFSYKHCQ